MKSKFLDLTHNLNIYKDLTICKVLERCTGLIGSVRLSTASDSEGPGVGATNIQSTTARSPHREHHPWLAQRH